MFSSYSISLFLNRLFPLSRCPHCRLHHIWTKYRFCSLIIHFYTTKLFILTQHIIKSITNPLFRYRIDLRITESWWYSIINVLERITYYRNYKGWTEYQLASASGLTQSTISSWYRKDLVPSIGSLEKICSAFGITLSQFFSEDESTSLYLTDTQKRLIEISSKLTPRQQDALIDLLNTL